MILVWTRAARGDREKIRARIAEHNPAAALALDESFSEKTALLAEYPHMGRPGRLPGTRELVAHPNYILIYDVKDGMVRILRLLHAARQWPPARHGS